MNKNPLQIGPWIRVMCDIFDDPKILMIRTLPDSDAIINIWFQLLTQAGKQKNDGVFTVNGKPYTDEMFAAVFQRPVNTVRLALRTFEEYGMIEIVNGTVIILNWGKYQSSDAIDRKREYQREYMQGYRAQQRLLAGSKTADSSEKSTRKTNSKTNSKSNSETNVRPPYTDTYTDTTPPTPPMGGEGEVVDDNPFSETASSAQPPDFNTVEVYAVNNLRVMKEGPMRELAEFKAELPDEVIRHAIDEACANGKPHWSYTRSILQRYEEEGIMTLGDAKASDAAFHKQKQQSQPQPSQRSSSEPRKDGWV